MNELQLQIEKTGEPFSIEGMLKARDKTWEVIEYARKKITPGMLETEATDLVEKQLLELGVNRKWHRTWIRFGVNTLLPYGKLSEPGTRLRENDIYFLDLGPIFEGHEGDCGTTFTVGSDPEMLRAEKDVKKIYDLVKEQWSFKNSTGKELYEYAHKVSNELGWILSLNEANGHRLSDFPHAIYHKGPIAALDFKPTSALWVLEIQIRHPEMPFGAFYEDLLV